MRAFALGFLACLPSCSTAPALPAGFCTAAVEAPEDQPLRLQFDGDKVVGAAVPLGPGRLPAAVRTMVEAIAPGGSTALVAREWGRRGDGYRIDKVYADGPIQQSRSALIAPDGRVLERSHSVPVTEVPKAVLLAAMTDTRREVLRAEIVSDGELETGWRLWLRDGAGRTFVCECGLDGQSAATGRVLLAQLLAPLAPPR